jgi:16S rRNA (uracil1498-N3)-methyltransferase
LKQFILPSAPDSRAEVQLGGKDYHYLVRVRRLAPGENFPALSPAGETVTVRILSTDGGILRGSCTEAGVSEQPPASASAGAAQQHIIPPIYLFQALPKGDKMDLIVRQAAEGGITEVVPFASEHAVAKIGSGAKIERWERIIKEGRQQSGSATATRLHPPLSFDGLLEYWEQLRNPPPGERSSSLALIFHQSPLAKASLHGYLDSSPKIVAYTVGPEGGFSSAEISRFLDAGFKALTIGDTVLRTETAALYGAAAIRTILLESASWKLKPH